MQTGVVTQDNLADVLRSISQRRRQGVLEIAAGRGTYKVSFVQGRIVEVRIPEMSPVQDLVAWLTRGGYPCQPWEMYPENNYQELFTRLQSDFTDGTTLSTEVYSLAVRHRILERLYRLDLGAGSLYTFRVQMVEAESGLSPSISVGQLLLDIVEMEGELQSVVAQFPPNSIIVPAAGRSDVNLPDEEKRILQVLHDGCSVDELEARSLLSSHAYRHGLLELKANNYISVRGGAPRREEGHPSADIGDFLDDSIDAAFAIDLSDHLDLDASAAQLSLDGLPIQGSPIDVSQEEALELAEIENAHGVRVRRSWKAVVAPLSAELLQSTVVPGLMATVFLIMALVFPLISWTPILSFFADR